MKARYLTENALETLKHSIDTYLPLFKEETNAALVEKLKGEPNPVFLLPNYTAMMELRDALSPETGARDFWE